LHGLIPLAFSKHHQGCFVTYLNRLKKFIWNKSDLVLFLKGNMGMLEKILFNKTMWRWQIFCFENTLNRYILCKTNFIIIWKMKFHTCYSKTFQLEKTNKTYFVKPLRPKGNKCANKCVWRHGLVVVLSSRNDVGCWFHSHPWHILQFCH
jgi:hypothetical protein